MVDVTFQKHQLYINGVPALVQAGTLDYARLPHPALWRPALERWRMAGGNAVVLPCPWAYHSPAPGFYDFTGPRDLDLLLAEVERAGLWLIVQAGPWQELHFNAGGLPAWVLSLLAPDPYTRWLDPPPALLRHLREWWTQLAARFAPRPNLLCVLLSVGPGIELPSVYQALGRELFTSGAPLIAGWAGVEGREASVGAPLLWGGLTRARIEQALPPEHPRPELLKALGAGARLTVLAPLAAGSTWGYWRAPDTATAYGVGAPLAEGGALTLAYFHLRRAALLAETLGQVLAQAAPTADVYAAPLEQLLAARSNGRTTAAFVRGAGPGAPLQLSLPAGNELFISPPAALPAGVTRVWPLNWPLAGGVLLSAALEPLLRMTVAGRQLLILTNDGGGDVLLSGDFRPRHARGPVRAQRTATGLTIHFEAERLISLLLDGPAEPLQLLALEPHLAGRVWPLDDAWRTTPAFPAAWAADPEEPARGLIIGPELVLPAADGGFTYLTAERGFGYRWGPWRGSDPHTWLAPFSWTAAAAPPLPSLTQWESRPAAVEALPGYDDSAWREASVAGMLALEAHAIHAGFAWYRGRFAGTASAVTLAFRHACDIFLNGAHIASLNAPPDDLESAPAPKTIPLPPGLLQAENLLAVLVESLGRAPSPAAAGRLHGLLSCVLEGGGPVHWRVRGGLSGEHQAQGFAGFADWQLVPVAGNPTVTWHRCEFTLRLPEMLEMSVFLAVENVPARALLFLNGQMIGQYWEARGPQRRFWLPDGILRRDGVNELLVAQWTRGAEPGLGTLRLEAGPVYTQHHELPRRVEARPVRW